MVKMGRSTVNQFLATHDNVFASEYAGKVMIKITAQTDKKRTVLQKLKGLLGKGRGRSSSNNLSLE